MDTKKWSIALQDQHRVHGQDHVIDVDLTACHLNCAFSMLGGNNPFRARIKLHVDAAEAGMNRNRQDAPKSLARNPTAVHVTDRALLRRRQRAPHDRAVTRVILPSFNSLVNPGVRCVSSFNLHQMRIAAGIRTSIAYQTRAYCCGAAILLSSSLAARTGQYGSRNNSRASRTRSASPLARISCA